MSSRIFNFSAGPAVMPLPVLEQAQRELVTLPGVGMSVMEISHRSKTFEDLLERRDRRHPRARGYSVELPPADAAGRRQPAVLNGADEPAPPGATADYIDTGTWADKAIKEAKRVGRVNITGSTKDRQLQPHSRRGRADADAGRRVRPHHVEQHHRRHGVADASGHRRRSARC